MAPILELHTLPSDKRAGELCRVVQMLYRDRQKVVIWMEDGGRRQILDDYLWTFHKLAFVPHLSWTPELGEVEDPVVLLSETGNPNQARALVVGDGLPPPEWAASFEQIHDFIEPGEAGEKRTLWWTSWKREHGVNNGEGSS